MSWTYLGTLATDLDVVRFELQDTAAPWKFTDAEINAVLTAQPVVVLAAARLWEVLAARYMGQIDYSNGALTEQKSQMRDHALEQAAALRARATEDGKAGAPFTIKVGGTSLTERDIRNTTEDTPPSDFQQGMLDHPLTESEFVSTFRR